jgi:cell wall assembly regulator SMI1
MTTIDALLYNEDEEEDIGRWGRSSPVVQQTTINDESTEGDVTSATKELGAIKTPDDQRETAPARDTRKDSTESTGG